MNHAKGTNLAYSDNDWNAPLASSSTHVVDFAGLLGCETGLARGMGADGDGAEDAGMGADGDGAGDAGMGMKGREEERAPGGSHRRTTYMNII